MECVHTSTSLLRATFALTYDCQLYTACNSGFLATGGGCLATATSTAPAQTTPAASLPPSSTTPPIPTATASLPVRYGPVQCRSATDCQNVNAFIPTNGNYACSARGLCTFSECIQLQPVPEVTLSPVLRQPVPPDSRVREDSARRIASATRTVPPALWRRTRTSRATAESAAGVSCFCCCVRGRPEADPAARSRRLQQRLLLDWRRVRPPSFDDESDFDHIAGFDHDAGPNDYDDDDDHDDHDDHDDDHNVHRSARADRYAVRHQHRLQLVGSCRLVQHLHARVLHMG